MELAYTHAKAQKFKNFIFRLLHQFCFFKIIWIVYLALGQPILVTNFVTFANGCLKMCLWRESWGDLDIALSVRSVIIITTTIIMIRPTKYRYLYIAQGRTMLQMQKW